MELIVAICNLVSAFISSSSSQSLIISIIWMLFASTSRSRARPRTHSIICETHATGCTTIFPFHEVTSSSLLLRCTYILKRVWSDHSLSAFSVLMVGAVFLLLLYQLIIIFMKAVVLIFVISWSSKLKCIEVMQVSQQDTSRFSHFGPIGWAHKLSNSAYNLINNIVSVLLKRLILLFDGWSRSSIALSSCTHKIKLNTKQTSKQL